VERRFGLITEGMIRRRTFHSVKELEHAIYEWRANWNEEPKPFTGVQLPMSFSTKYAVVKKYSGHHTGD
jgi:hypothetical protein